ncbi:MAG: hypothetical protein BZY81_03855 [SAR202 cluster bacterium Io17-Chloro-G4]|nr:MAG: hypothetical protein BZY81_03855 [SAR202 cluster bacterium Io17-Chloro-G4]
MVPLFLGYRNGFSEIQSGVTLSEVKGIMRGLRQSTRFLLASLFGMTKYKNLSRVTLSGAKGLGPGWRPPDASPLRLAQHDTSYWIEKSAGVIGEQT